MRTTFVLALGALSGAAVARPHSARNAPPRPENWLINFGDSYSKTGFEPSDAQPSAENPIGNPALPGRTSSGGLNWVGYMMTEFNTSFSSDPNSQTLAYNFGHSGGAVNAKPFRSQNPDFNKQMDWFEENYVNIERSKRRWTTENSVAGVWYGVNDVNGIFAKGLDVQNKNGAIIIDLMKTYMAGLERLYSFGLRKYIMITVPPLSMLPLKLKWKENKISELNSCVQIWNYLLHEKVRAFKENHDDVVATVIEVKDIYWDALSRPEDFNAPDTTCNDATGETCLWFDTGHPNTSIMRLIAARVAKVLETDEYRCYGNNCKKDGEL